MFEFLNAEYPAQNDVQAMQGNMPPPEQMVAAGQQGAQPGPQDMAQQEMAEPPSPMMDPADPMMQEQAEGMPMAKKGGKWIQKATKSIKERGTEGKCSGANFGGPDCPPGSKQYNLAKTFKKMAKRRKKRAKGGYTRMHGDDMHDDVYVGDTYIGGYAHPNLVLGYGGNAPAMMGMGGYSEMEKGGGLPQWLYDARGEAMKKNMMNGGRMTMATMGYGGYPMAQRGEYVGPKPSGYLEGSAPGSQYWVDKLAWKQGKLTKGQINPVYQARGIAEQFAGSSAAYPYTQAQINRAAQAGRQDNLPSAGNIYGNRYNRNIDKKARMTPFEGAPLQNIQSTDDYYGGGIEQRMYGGRSHMGYGGRMMYGYGGNMRMGMGGGLRKGDYVEFQDGGKTVSGVITDFDPMTGDFMVS